MRLPWNGTTKNLMMTDAPMAIAKVVMNLPPRGITPM